MTPQHPSDSRCWHCDRKRCLTWSVSAWLCVACRRDQRHATHFTELFGDRGGNSVDTGANAPHYTEAR